MPRSTQTIVSAYNSLLMSSIIPIQIIEWKSTATEKYLKLSTGVILDDPREFRVFGSRCKSPLLLPHMGQLYAPTTLDRECIIKQLTAANVKQIRLAAEQTQAPNITQRRLEHMRAIREMRRTTGFKQGHIPWQKGLTKNDHPTLQRIANERSGTGNPMWGSTISEENRTIKSQQVRDRILNGSWTPHQHNSRTHWQCVVNGHKYRSSWEALFHMLNPEFEYEQTRIQYQFEDRSYVYIIDFTDNVSKRLIEIRPTERSTDAKTIAKIEAATKWAVQHGYTFELISQQYFITNYHLLPNDVEDIIPDGRSKLRKIKHEATK